MQVPGFSPELPTQGSLPRAARVDEPSHADRGPRPTDLLQVQSHLARSFGHAQASLACEYLDTVVRPQAVDSASWDAEKERFTALMALTGDASMARRARELLQKESGGETPEQRFQLFSTLVTFEKGLGELPLDSRSDRLPEPRMDPPVRAIFDYRAALEGRPHDQSLTEAVETVRTVHRHVAPRAGWRSSHEAVLFLRDGCTQGTFPGRNREEAFREFLRTWLMTQSLDRCREVLRHAPDETPPPSVEKKPDEVVIGGIRVPRKSGMTQVPPRPRPARGRDHGLA